MESSSIFIIGGGTSLQNFDFSCLAFQDTIVINQAIFDVPYPNYFITSDYTFLRKINVNNFKHVKTTKVFVANKSHEYLREINGRIVDTRFNLIYNLEDFNVIIKSYNKSGMGRDFADFRNGENSGFCALQLAAILGYEKIYLLGIDLICKENTHYHDGYKQNPIKFTQKLDTYYQEFEKGIRQFRKLFPDREIISCSPISRLNGIVKYKNIEDVL